MKPALALAGFAALLVVVFAAAYGAGAAIGPEPDAPAPHAPTETVVPTDPGVPHGH
ncbi:hypothetical protein [Rhodococcus sp. HNM0569]|uniref:hypothetical protein n=1 Tax=Rhodococcus sp. HNM0569 TaxID=2716340 RepID=UPI00146B621A|nr:hypothetical protein [Rhodococcus sp. HNM0569]NLU84554.1 hypothetical protein [Rhodococcus sp. HNM0569]